MYNLLVELRRSSGTEKVVGIIKKKRKEKRVLWGLRIWKEIISPTISFAPRA